MELRQLEARQWKEDKREQGSMEQEAWGSAGGGGNRRIDLEVVKPTSGRREEGGGLSRVRVKYRGKVGATADRRPAERGRGVIRR